MNHTKGVDEVVLFPWNDFAELLNISLIEAGLEPKQVEPSLTQPH
jgi:hypothetical protein